MIPTTSQFVRRASSRVLFAGLALGSVGGSVWAQDSTSTNGNGGNGLPGDSLSPFATGTPFQQANYVVDLTPFATSWGTPLGIGPVLKSVKVSEARFNAVNGPSVMSSAVRTRTLSAPVNYQRWAAAGAGLSPTQNSGAGAGVALSGDVVQLGVAVLDFDEQTVGANSVFVNALTSARIRYVATDPTRLYVTRTGIAINATTTTQDSAQFGLGSVDIDGGVMFRADGFQSLVTTPLQGDNYFYTNASTRVAGTVNLITNTGGSNATSWLMQQNTTTASTPAMVPSEADGPTTLLGANFAGQLVVRGVGGALTFPTTHLAGGVDHRGAASASTRTLWPNTRASGAILARTSAGGSGGGTGATDAIAVFGISATNTITNARLITLPSSVLDACDAFNWPINGGDFRQYDSQAVFRGGTGPVAVGKDQAGRGLVAATVYNGSQLGSDNPFNAILAARFDPATNAPAQWTTIAWVDTAGGDGKDILGDYGVDGAPNTGDAGEGDGVVNQQDAPVGRITSLNDLPQGFRGPSLSAPAFDSAGNAYFIASVALRKAAGQIIQEERDIALLRAVYNPSTFCYQLELVLEQGMVFAGTNSQRNYRLAWMGLADEDSVASSTLWSGNVASEPWGSADTSNLPTVSPLHLGGISLSARIVYDTDQNGQFNDPTAVGGVQNSPDEAYNVVLYVGNVTPSGPSCDSIDFNNDGGLFDPTDIDAFLSVYSEGPCVPASATCNDIDFNNDGAVFDPCDIDSFLLAFSEGPCTNCGQ